MYGGASCLPAWFAFRQAELLECVGMDGLIGSHQVRDLLAAQHSVVFCCTSSQSVGDKLLLCVVVGGGDGALCVS